MAAGQLLGRANTEKDGLNWVFLIYLLLCGAVLVFFLFYATRLFAAVISYTTRTIIWYTFRARVDFTSIQISPLGGRIFFKGFRYYAQNQTILIHDGRITWRYWLWITQKASIFRLGTHSTTRSAGVRSEGAEATELGRNESETSHSTRLQIRVTGVEVFIYNNTPAYDLVVSQFEDAKSSRASQNARDGNKPGKPADEFREMKKAHTSSKEINSEGLGSIWTFLRLLPVQLKYKKAAAVIGNENTSSVVVFKSEEANGIIDAAESGPRDLFKLLIGLDCLENTVHMHENDDFHVTHIDDLEDVTSHRETKRQSSRPGKASSFSRFTKWFRSAFPLGRSSAGSVLTSVSYDKLNDKPSSPAKLTMNEPWHGLARFLNTSSDDLSREWDDAEYAKHQLTANLDRMELSIHWDIPGLVPDNIDAEQKSPDYSVDVVLHGGSITYGPWADKERALLQSIFLPTSQVDSTPYNPHLSGDFRVPASLNINIQLDEQILLRVPTRESSKDWKWKKDPTNEDNKHWKTAGKPTRRRKRKSAKEKATNHTIESRSPGWLDVIIKRDTTFHYSMAMFPDINGNSNSLTGHVKGLEVLTSINQDLLCRCADIHIDADLSNPLKWNQLRRWIFNVTCHDLDLFILRDHMFLFSDLGTDWASGPPPAFYTFVPFIYELVFKLDKFRILISVNDANLINDPTDMDVNTFLILAGDTLDVVSNIPIDQFRPVINTITFDLIARNLSMRMHTPLQNTLHDLLKDDLVAKLPAFALKGSYMYFQEQSSENIDVLSMNIEATELVLLFYGYLLRYFLNLKENYFGQYLHFRTLEEYQASGGDNLFAVRDAEEKLNYRKTNGLDVILKINLVEPKVVIPSQLHSASNGLQLSLQNGLVNIKATNHFFDLVLDFGPISISTTQNPWQEKDTTTVENLQITSVAVHGHRLFGEAPAEPAYVSAWDVDVGSLEGTCTTELVYQAAKAIKAFDYTLDDLENVLPNCTPIPDPDMLFLRARIDYINIAIQETSQILLVGSDTLYFRLDDVPDDATSLHLSALINDATLAVIDTEKAEQKLCLYIQTSLDVNLRARNSRFSDTRSEKIEHVRKQDSATHRAQFILEPLIGSKAIPVVLSRALPSLPAFVQPVNFTDNLSNDFREPAKQSLSVIDRFEMSKYLHSSELAILNEIPSISVLGNGYAPQDDNAEGFLTDVMESDIEYTWLTITSEPGIQALIKPQVVLPIMRLIRCLDLHDGLDAMESLDINVMKKMFDQTKGSALKPKKQLKLRFVNPTLQIMTVVEQSTYSKIKGTPVRINLEIANTRFDFSVSDFDDKLGEPISRLSANADLIHMYLKTSNSTIINSSKLSVELQNICTKVVKSSDLNTIVNFGVITTTMDLDQAAAVASDLVVVALEVNGMIDDLENYAQKTTRSFDTLSAYMNLHHGKLHEPSYMSRMIDVRRAFPNHVRNQVSWRILARFRDAYERLTPEENLEMNEFIKRKRSPDIPSATKESLSWLVEDPTDTANTSFLETLVPESITKAQSPGNSRHFTLDCSLTRFLTNEQRRGSEISFTDLSLEGVDQKAMTKALDSNQLDTLTMTIKTSMIFIRLKWELVEAAQAVMEIFHMYQKQSTITSHAVAQQKLDRSTSRIHIVWLSNDITSIIDTINLNCTTSIKAWQTSFLSEPRDGSLITLDNLVLGCDNLATEFNDVRDSEGRILHVDLKRPSIAVEFGSKSLDSPDSINVAATYQVADIAVEKDPVWLLSAVDRVLADEVDVLLDVYNDMQRRHTSPSPVDKTDGDLSPINLVILSGSYEIAFAVLQSLIINIQGNRANLHIKPQSQAIDHMLLDVDIGPVRVAAISEESGIAGEEALFFTPSTAISLRVMGLDTRPEIRLVTTIDKMKIEAAALRNIFTLLRRPVVQSLIDTLKTNAVDVNYRLDRLLSHHKIAKGSVKDNSKQLPRYHARINWKGLDIIATAKVAGSTSRLAELVLGLARTEVTVHNESTTSADHVSIPVILAKVESIFVSLYLVENNHRQPCGHARMALLLQTEAVPEQSKSFVGDILIASDFLDVEVSTDTASTMVDVITHIQQKLVMLDLTKEIEYLRKLRSNPRQVIKRKVSTGESPAKQSVWEMIETLTPSHVAVSLKHIRLAWITTVQEIRTPLDWRPEDLELSFARVELAIRQTNQMRLAMESLQLRMVPKGFNTSSNRSINSAFLPEMVFMVMLDRSSRGVDLSFQAIGQRIEVNLDSGFVGPLGLLIRSVQSAMNKYREASRGWHISPTASRESLKSQQSSPVFTIHRRLASVRLNVEFAGGILFLKGTTTGRRMSQAFHSRTRSSESHDSSYSTNDVQAELKSPGVALMLEYVTDRITGAENKLTGELKVDASTNTLHPEVVPVIVQIYNGAKETMQASNAATQAMPSNDPKNNRITLPDESMLDKNEILARTNINLGLRISKQEFCLSCQPIAKIDAKAEMDEIYIALNTLKSTFGKRFISITSNMSKLSASVQHLYSRNATFSFDMQKVKISVMNSKHIKDSIAGLSAVVNLDNLAIFANAKQVQDILLFRQIWFPENIKSQCSIKPATPVSREQVDEMLMDKYRHVTQVAAFPWNVIINLKKTILDVDLGQSIGRSTVEVQNIWASSEKTSGWKQELCIGVDKITAASVGRLDCAVELTDGQVRTVIEWSVEKDKEHQTPMIQASFKLSDLMCKAAFDHQPFIFAHLGGLSFIMYNNRDGEHNVADRLIATLNLDHAYTYLTASSPAQAFAVYQTFDRLIQEKQNAFKESVNDVQRQLQRPSISTPFAVESMRPLIEAAAKSKSKSHFRLKTDVVVQINNVNVGIYPSTFFDSQVLKADAVDCRARFAVDVQEDKIHSDLGLVLGRVYVALAQPKRIVSNKSINDIMIKEILDNVVSAKGGIILRVPRLVAAMQTWQGHTDKVIDYIFKSTFEGKIDVGWNYARISYIRAMWNTHTKTLAARLGKPLPASAVQITTTASADDLMDDSGEASRKGNEDTQQGKITATVNVPLSKYEYRPVEPPIIETPQLRDMGEATPPLEWIGLQRDKLPNVIHQVVIVSLLELVKEVEDAYGKILGTS